jgi:hypothetical protein
MRSTMGRHSRYSMEMLIMSVVAAMMTTTTMVHDHKSSYMVAIKADVIASDSVAQRISADYASGIKGGNRQSNRQKMMMMRRRRRKEEGESDETDGYGESKYKFNGDQSAGGNVELVSVLGDGGMRDQRVRVALESWNFCNRVGLSPPASPHISTMNSSSSSSSSSSDPQGYSMPSPRRADCTDLICIGITSSALF